jgi:fatty acid desaturase
MKPNIAHFFGNGDVDYFFWDPLFPKGDPKRQAMINWARFTVIGHLILLGVFIYFKLWVLIYTVTFGYFFATFLVHGCEIQQHLGLYSNVPDWRLSTYTATFHPIISFLYWRMHYHIDHHMYAGVPFYNVPKLHKILAHDLPKPVEGYLSGIKKVLSIQKQQRVNPDYCFMQEFPNSANPAKMAASMN